MPTMIRYLHHCATAAHRRFREKRESVEDDGCCGFPHENGEKVSVTVQLFLKTRNCVLFIRPPIRKSIGNLETPQSPYRRFQSADKVKSASHSELKDMDNKGFFKCFNDLHKQWQMSVVVQGSHFPRGCVLAI
ncbi:hypothetical protein TNCV_4910921 [Trichonephila clavipes]|nr:hypothetical protein TNCV_4910921 [Trichonephila clavipes]